MGDLRTTSTNAMQVVSGLDGTGLASTMVRHSEFHDRQYTVGNFTETQFADCDFDEFAMRTCMCSGMRMDMCSLTNVHFMACYSMLGCVFTGCEFRSRAPIYLPTTHVRRDEITIFSARQLYFANTSDITTTRQVLQTMVDSVFEVPIPETTFTYKHRELFRRRADDGGNRVAALEPDVDAPLDYNSSDRSVRAFMELHRDLVVTDLSLIDELGPSADRKIMLSGSEFDHCVLEDVIFLDCDFYGCKFNRTTLRRCHFRFCTWGRNFFTDCTIDSCTGINFDYAVLDGCRLDLPLARDGIRLRPLHDVTRFRSATLLRTTMHLHAYREETYTVREPRFSAAEIAAAAIGAGALTAGIGAGIVGGIMANEMRDVQKRRTVRDAVPPVLTSGQLRRLATLTDTSAPPDAFPVVSHLEGLRTSLYWSNAAMSTAHRTIYADTLGGTVESPTYAVLRANHSAADFRRFFRAVVASLGVDMPASFDDAPVPVDSHYAPFVQGAAEDLVTYFTAALAADRTLTDELELTHFGRLYEKAVLERQRFFGIDRTGVRVIRSTFRGVDFMLTNMRDWRVLSSAILDTDFGWEQVGFLDRLFDNTTIARVKVLGASSFAGTVLRRCRLEQNIMQLAARGADADAGGLEFRDCSIVRTRFRVSPLGQAADADQHTQNRTTKAHGVRFLRCDIDSSSAVDPTFKNEDVNGFVRSSFTGTVLVYDGDGISFEDCSLRDAVLFCGVDTDALHGEKLAALGLHPMKWPALANDDFQTPVPTAQHVIMNGVVDLMNTQILAENSNLIFDGALVIVTPGTMMSAALSRGSARIPASFPHDRCRDFVSGDHVLAAEKRDATTTDLVLLAAGKRDAAELDQMLRTAGSTTTGVAVRRLPNNPDDRTSLIPTQQVVFPSGTTVVLAPHVSVGDTDADADAAAARKHTTDHQQLSGADYSFARLDAQGDPTCATHHMGARLSDCSVRFDDEVAGLLVGDHAQDAADVNYFRTTQRAIEVAFTTNVFVPAALATKPPAPRRFLVHADVDARRRGPRLLPPHGARGRHHPRRHAAPPWVVASTAPSRGARPARCVPVASFPLRTVRADPTTAPHVVWGRPTPRLSSASTSGSGSRGSLVLDPAGGAGTGLRVTLSHDGDGVVTRVDITSGGQNYRLHDEIPTSAGVTLLVTRIESGSDGTVAEAVVRCGGDGFHVYDTSASTDASTGWVRLTGDTPLGDARARSLHAARATAGDDLWVAVRSHTNQVRVPSPQRHRSLRVDHAAHHRPRRRRRGGAAPRRRGHRGRPRLRRQGREPAPVCH